MTTGADNRERLKVMRVFHAGRNPAHRARDRALVDAGVDVVYVVPRHWPEPGSEERLSEEPFPIIEVDVRRPGDVNRHSHTDPDQIVELAHAHRVDVLDIFEEPFSRAAGQLIPRLPKDLPVVMYSAQNLDKRWPPPFHWYEERSLSRAQGFYPCSRQAASVLRGRGYNGIIDPLPLGYDPTIFYPGDQSLENPVIQLALVGRMVREKGVEDAIRILHELKAVAGIDSKLVLVGSGPATIDAIRLAKGLGVDGRVEHVPWVEGSDLADIYRNTHVLLAPSLTTATWVEQFGRMIVEGQVSGCVVAGYKTGTIPEVGGTSAILASEGAWQALAASIAAVIRSPDGYLALRSEGIAAKQNWTWESVAARQAHLYAAAALAEAGAPERGSPRRLRAMAQAEFGPTATAVGQRRPFALPLLRRPGSISKAIGGLMDLAGEIGTRWRTWR